MLDFAHPMMNLKLFIIRLILLLSGGTRIHTAHTVIPFNLKVTVSDFKLSICVNLS